MGAADCTEQFPLFTFETEVGDVITRGRTQEEAQRYLVEFCSYRIAKPLSHNSCAAAFSYSTNHPFDWLNQPPLWLRPRELAPSDPWFKERFRRTAKLAWK